MLKGLLKMLSQSLDVYEDHAPAGSRQVATGFLKMASLEVLAANEKMIKAAIELCPPGREVFIADPPKADSHLMVSAAMRLRAAGLVPVPHIVARKLTDKAALRSLLNRLREAADIDRVLILGGDRPDPVGDFAASLEVLATDVLPEYGIRKIFIAGYPEGHPHISDQDLRYARAEKLKLARKAGLEVTLISQFCFDPEPIVRFANTLEEVGADIPYRVGLASPAKVSTLIKYSMMCGVGPSVRFLRDRTATAGALLSDGSLTDLFHNLVEAKTTGVASNIAGVHFFTFGSLQSLDKWVRQQQA